MDTAKLFITAASLTLAGILAHPAVAAGAPGIEMHRHAPRVPAAAVADRARLQATRAALRDLWIGHVFWVRNVAVAELAGNAPARQAAEQQVVANAQSIAASIEPFYGAAARKALFDLLAGHYGAVKAYLDATVARNEGQQAEAIASLTGNASGIAVFLSRANPYLPKDAVDGLLQAHGGHHIVQIQQLQARDYAGEAQTWSDMSRHMYVVADALADALAKQFPAKF